MPQDFLKNIDTIISNEIINKLIFKFITMLKIHAILRGSVGSSKKNHTTATKYLDLIQSIFYLQNWHLD